MKRVYRSPTSVLSYSLPLQCPGGLVPEKLGGGVWPASQNPYPTYNQNLQSVITVTNILKNTKIKRGTGDKIKTMTKLILPIVDTTSRN